MHLVPHPHATKEQRRRVLTGTDMRRLNEGKWREVWDEKMGHTEPFDGTFVWVMRLGQKTEDLHAWWHGYTEGVNVMKAPDTPCYNPKLDLPAHWACTLDFWVSGDSCPLETKHRHARATLRSAAEEAMPQLQWQLLITDCPHLRFSIIAGNEEPVWGLVERDEGYIERLKAQAHAFWQLVEQDIPPEEQVEPDKVMAELARQIPINKMRDYDFSQNNAWCAFAADYVRLKPLVDECDKAKEELKALVPADASLVTGAGVRISRNKKGSLTLTIPKAEELDA